MQDIYCHGDSSCDDHDGKVAEPYEEGEQEEPSANQKARNKNASTGLIDTQNPLIKPKNELEMKDLPGLHGSRRCAGGYVGSVYDQKAVVHIPDSDDEPMRYDESPTVNIISKSPKYINSYAKPFANV